MNVTIVGANSYKKKKDGSTFYEYYCTTKEYVEKGTRTCSFLSKELYGIGDSVHLFFSQSAKRFFPSKF